MHELEVEGDTGPVMAIFLYKYDRRHVVLIIAPYQMSTLPLYINYTIFQVQGDMNLIDRRQTTTVANVDSFNVMTTTLAGQSSAPESPFGHGILHLYFARATSSAKINAVRIDSQLRCFRVFRGCI